MAFWSRFPYTDDHQLNLDWVIKEIQKIRAASGITYDDDQTQLGADNVQTAIEKLNDLIAQVAQMSSAFNLVDNAIAPTRWENGYTYSHLQTVNDATLMAICNAVKDNKLVVLKIANGSNAAYFYEEAITEIPGDYQHIVYLYDPFTLTRLALVINGLNDAQNIFCQILPADTKTMVNEFNGRDGNVSPEAGDYAAEQVSFSDPDFTATDVKDAIKEVDGKIPASVVNTFNGRNGAVNPQTSDYNAQQIDYDNSVSGIAATNVQAAIDRVITMIFASGVASFNSRVGIVLPLAHDYDGSMIDYVNTGSGLAATNVQDAIDELAGPLGVTITLTLNGAMEDTITVKDSNNVTLGTCIFAAGQTSGTLTLTVPSGYNESCTFTSSVAKDTTLGTSDYVKTATVTDSLSQTVDVYPDGMIYWYGNGSLTGIGMAWSLNAPTVNPTLTINTNSINFSGADTGSFAITGESDFTTRNSLKTLLQITSASDVVTLMGKSNISTPRDADVLGYTELLPSGGTLSKAIYSTSISGNGNNYAVLHVRGGNGLSDNAGAIWALWLE